MNIGYDFPQIFIIGYSPAHRSITSYQSTFQSKIGFQLANRKMKTRLLTGLKSVVFLGRRSKNAHPTRGRFSPPPTLPERWRAKYSAHHVASYFARRRARQKGHNRTFSARGSILYPRAFSHLNAN
jgi:hypothetical protein